MAIFEDVIGALYGPKTFNGLGRPSYVLVRLRSTFQLNIILDRGRGTLIGVRAW